MHKLQQNKLLKFRLLKFIFRIAFYFKKAIALITIKTIAKTNIVKIIIIKKNIKRNLNLERIKTKINSSLTRIRRRIIIIKSKRLLE